MMKALACAGALALAAASAEANCVSRADVEAWVAANAPDATVRVLAGEEARLFLAAYNDTPPKTGISGDEIVIVSMPREAGSLRVGLFDGGCMTRAARMPEAAVRRLLAVIERGGA